MHGSTTLIPEEDNGQKNLQVVLDSIAENEYQKKKNGSILIFDFDQTIVKSPMCNLFVPNGYDDYDSGKENAVTREKIEEFLRNPGIKNKEKLRSVLQSALSSGTEAAVVSTTYPKTVEYIVKNYLDLTEEQAQSIKVSKYLKEQLSVKPYESKIQQK